MDNVVVTERFPKEGETLIGMSFNKFPGGKGANQAVAAARLGAKVAMAGKVGHDSDGECFKSLLENEGIDIEFILSSLGNSHTGIGSITIDHLGENKIIIVPGANLEYSLDDLQILWNEVDLQDIQVILLQNEMRTEVIETAITLAHNAAKTVIYNPAPAKVLDEKIYKMIDYITPNEHELSLIANQAIHTFDDTISAAKTLLDKGVKNVIVTLGKKGCLFLNKETKYHSQSYPVQTKDTVAAGDSFNGALAYGIDAGLDLKETLNLANKVGALTVTKSGAIPSLPTMSDVTQAFEN